jgi:hypothetical protein
MKVKETFLSLGHLKLNNGENIRFWEDRWLGNFTLQQQYPPLYAITRRKNVSVSSVFSTIPLNIPFEEVWLGITAYCGIGWLRVSHMLDLMMAKTNLDGVYCRMVFSVLVQCIKW